MIYNIVIYFVLWGIAIASLFNEKVRKMWRGEREAFKILKQKVNTRNPRSTVGTSTEIYEYLRLLYARVGKTISVDM